MATRFFSLLAVVLGTTTLPALAQLPAVISAPVSEQISRKQIIHQSITGLQMGEGKTLAAAMTKVSGQIKGIMDQTQALHDQWYSSLLQISSGVRSYRRVQEIYDAQTSMLNQYAAAKSQLGPLGLTSGQVVEASSVYGTLLQENVGLLSELVSVLTAGKAKMSDPERIEYIDGIADRIQKQQSLMSYFTSKCKALAGQQSQRARDLQAMQVLMK